MTRFPYDQFAKEFLEELLKPLGDVKAPREVKGEVRQIDVWFAPVLPTRADALPLGLLGLFAATPALFEPLRVRQSLMGETPKTALAHRFAILLR